MYGKEYGLVQEQYMYALWSVRAYIAGYIQPDTPKIEKALSDLPAEHRARVLSDIRDRVNATKSDAALKAWRDQVILSALFSNVS